MKYEIKYNSINQIINGQKSLYTIFKIISTYDIKEENILNNFSNILSQLIDNYDASRYYNISKSSITDFKRYIDNHKYDFIKKEKRFDTVRNEYYYYYQLVFFSDRLERENIYYNIFYRIDECIKRASVSFVEDIKYSYTVIYNNGDYGQQIYWPTDNSTRDLFNRIGNYLKDICVSIEINKEKSYKGSNAIKMNAIIYNDFKEAVNNRNSNTWIISGGNDLGVLCFGRINRLADGSYKYVCEYNNKFKADYIKDKVVFYDGEKSFDLVKNNIEGWNCNFVSITQFSKNKDFFHHTIRSNAIKKILLHFINSDRIISGEIRADDFNSSFTGTVNCRIKNNYRMGYNICKRQGILNGEYVVPYNPNDNTSSKALYYINKLILSNNLDIDSLNKYKDILFKKDYDEDDILLQWFDYCSGTNKNNNMKIINAYKKMRDNLIGEYKQLGYYVNNYDFSKCSPIPTIKIDNKLKNNFYKTFHIEAKNVIIKKINKINIKPIEDKQVYVRGMFPIKDIHQREDILFGEVPLKRFYNSKDNAIELNYIKLKGEIYNDKVKNRR